MLNPFSIKDIFSSSKHFGIFCADKNSFKIVAKEINNTIGIEWYIDFVSVPEFKSDEHKIILNTLDIINYYGNGNDFTMFNKKYPDCIILYPLIKNNELFGFSIFNIDNDSYFKMFSLTDDIINSNGLIVLRIQDISPLIKITKIIFDMSKGYNEFVQGKYLNTSLSQIDSIITNDGYCDIYIDKLSDLTDINNINIRVININIMNRSTYKLFKVI